MTCRRCWHFECFVNTSSTGVPDETYYCEGPHERKLTVIEVDFGCDQFASAKDKDEWDRIVNRNW